MADKMAADCKPVKGKVKGPLHHQLCATHGHVLDVNAKTIIAKDIKDYEAQQKKKIEQVWKTLASASHEKMAADCEPVHGKLKGTPENIVLCGAHKHVLDVKAKVVIAKDENELMAKWERALTTV